ncbi:MAG: hypothetical protein AVDCRST_MAG88-4237, partial [uncultured Thermomicrobiales bacterium]
ARPITRRSTASLNSSPRKGSSNGRVPTIDCG